MAFSGRSHAWPILSFEPWGRHAELQSRRRKCQCKTDFVSRLVRPNFRRSGLAVICSALGGSSEPGRTSVELQSSVVARRARVESFRFESNPTHKRHSSEVLRIERENVITTIKPKLVQTLADHIKLTTDRDAFLLLTKRVDAVVRAWYNRQFEELLQLYVLFDPAVGAKKLKNQKLTAAQVDKLEQTFLGLLFKVLWKSNFKLLTDSELKVSKKSSYLLNLPIEVDHAKLDKKLLTKYFDENPPKVTLPASYGEYVIFRRGIGIDRQEDFFVMEKVNVIILKMWHSFMEFIGLRERTVKTDVTVTRDGKSPTEEEEKDDLVVERIRIQNMDINFNSIFNKNTVQEPTFEKMLLVYRSATKEKDTSELGDRAIHLKQFRHIPMADMEIVLPEKKTPGLTPLDLVKVLGSIVGGLAAFVGTVKTDAVDLWVALAILSAFLGYCAKVYFTFQQAQIMYQKVTMEAMYDKQLDSGRGTLLHLCDDVIQEEVKEVILAYFVLMTQGKASLLELDDKCEELLEHEFHEIVNFDVTDAVAKLEKLGIVVKDAAGQFVHQPLDRANDIIGLTTDEKVGSFADV